MKSKIEPREPAEVLGNTETKTIKKQVCQAIHWVFTYNNYRKEDIESLEPHFKNICNMYAFQEEIGEQGTPHLQGVISLKRKDRYTHFTPIASIHWEVCRHVPKGYEYATKSETRKKGSKPYLFNYAIPTPLKILKKEQFYNWQIELYDYLQQEPDDRKIYWIWSRIGGKGKSQFCKYLIYHHNALYIDEAKKSDIMSTILKHDMDKCRIVLLDVPRANGNKISYKSLESIKNGVIYSGKYEGGYKLFNAPHIVVFANEEPVNDNSIMSSDRYIIKNVD